jgi:hypothetical protein
MHADASIEQVHSKAVWGGRVKLAMALVCALLTGSCSEAVRTGDADSYLVMTTLTGGPQNDATVESDVVSDTGSIFTDVGTALFTLQMKDTLDAPSPNNFITVTQYKVEYIRSDGHNIPGVDVPFPFTSGVNVRISGTGSVGFTLVRIQAKEEAPLKALRFSGGAIAISTVARVTFYGKDQTGREVSVSGNLDVTFADWAG